MEALLLDAGNTVVFLDVDAVAGVARAQGVEVSARALAAVEGAAKRRYEGALGAGGSHEDGWGLYLATLLAEAGVEPQIARALLGPLRAAHDELNLWRRVPDDLFGALEAARAMGLRVGIVSNSEGRLPELFAAVGLGDAFDVIVDSAIEGVHKPDPEIFRRALARLGVAPARALYAGDLPAVDVDGALGAGLHAALIDPLGFYPDHARSPRHASVAELVADLRRARR
ncbi:MAG: HAD family hydrolase [Sandaracinaceae bacterium]|nr:HAD family hydrolase [Sandaracinaceae bacterium]